MPRPTSPPLEVPTQPGPELEPSWGPIGSWLKRDDPARYEQVLKAHEQLLAQAKSRHAPSDTRACARCGAAFTPTRANHRFCSNTCLSAARAA